MKLDPDERLTDDLKASLRFALAAGDHDGYLVVRRLWFMATPMPVRQNILRVWRTGKCRFSDVLVNEHPIVDGSIGRLNGDLEHHDSPNLHHWLDKQNQYTTQEAISAFRGDKLVAQPRLFGNRLERRMWLKSFYPHVPFRHCLMYLYCLFVLGAWRAGRVGFTWARLRAFVFRMREDKLAELQLLGVSYEIPRHPPGPVREEVAQAK